MCSYVNDKKIGLALSGGGIRALAFHAGVLKCFAEYGILKNITNISTVSGGSLFTGLVFNFSKYEWPNDTIYLRDVLPSIRNLITTTSLQNDAIKALIFNPLNWRFALRRGHIIANCLKSLWHINAKLSDLPIHPIWSINGTTGENGRRFRFKSGVMGDYKIGYASAKNFDLATAMAISAAFPVGIGPIGIDVSQYDWEKSHKWDSIEKESIIPQFTTLHIYDGGLYDNLGSETFFDMGKQAIKPHNDVDYIIMSDASAPLIDTSLPSPFSPKRTKKIADILTDQCRALRVRSFVNFQQNNNDKAMYIYLGEFDDILSENIIQNQKQQNINKAKHYPTNLDRMSEEDFDLLVEVGYQSTLSKFCFK